MTALSCRFGEDDLARALRHWQAQSQRTRYTLRAERGDPRRRLAREVEGEAAGRLAGLGFDVRATRHTSHFDLLAIGDTGALRCEVKAATWGGARYQFNLHGNDADVVLVGCVDGALRWFVIPFDQVRGLTVVKICRHDPADYAGRLARYFEAWGSLPDLARSARNPYQLDLLGEVMQ